MTKKKHSASSKRWLKEHREDKYVQKAQKLGLRSRAVFKLDELNLRDQLIKAGDVVVDLGAAPGGWSQYCAEQVGTHGLVIACDILPMDSLAGVEFLQGDFREQTVLDALMDKIGENRVNTILSDMAPNLSGNSSVDQSKAMYLCELAFDMCQQVLVKNGNFVIKVFQGEGFEEYFRTIKKVFKSVKTRKPDSSRARSREVYLVAKGYII